MQSNSSSHCRRKMPNHSNRQKTRIRAILHWLVASRTPSDLFRSVFFRTEIRTHYFPQFNQSSSIQVARKLHSFLLKRNLKTSQAIDSPPNKSKSLEWNRKVLFPTNRKHSSCHWPFLCSENHQTIVGDSDWSAVLTWTTLRWSFKRFRLMSFLIGFLILMSSSLFPCDRKIIYAN